MSTRSQLRFTHGAHTAQLYRHSDGYPSTVVPSLGLLQEILAATGALRGPDYAAANYIFFEKMDTLRQFYVNDDTDYREDLTPEQALYPGNYDQFGQPAFLLGYGVEDTGRWHGDEEYLYEVDIEQDGWYVKVSEHNGFPRWDALDELAEDEDPWDRIKWEFEGSLDDALHNYS